MSDLTARWITDAEKPSDAPTIGWCGGDLSQPTWETYLSRLTEDEQQVVTAIKEAHERDGLDVYGDDMNEGGFLLSDGRFFQCSWRAWGDLRQAFVNKQEGYLRYYAGV